MSKSVAIIPARGGSKGVPRKNIRTFCGKPLIAYTIESAKDAASVDRIIVSTDDEEIAGIARQYGADVPFLRPAELAQDDVADFPVLEHALQWLDEKNEHYDYVVFLRPTNVFRTGKDIDRAIDKMSNSDYDSVRAISKAVYPPYWMKRVEGDKIVPFVETEFEAARRQDLPDVYQGNGTVDVIKRETILEKKSLYGQKIGFVEMEEIATTDIDTELDFQIAEFLYARWEKGKGVL